MAYNIEDIGLYQNCVCVIPIAGTEAQDPNCPTCIEKSEICDIWMDCCDPDDPRQASNPIAGWQGGAALGADETLNTTAITTWLQGVDNQAPGAVRHFTVRGSQTDSEAEQIPLPKDLFASGDKTFTQTLEFFPLCQQTREFLRGLQCGGTVCTWHKTIGNGFYGGEHGITAGIKNVSLPKELGGYTKGTVTLEWKEKVDAPRDFYELPIS